jgi:AmiR/NasT family two-component response regulator
MAPDEPGPPPGELAQLLATLGIRDQQIVELLREVEELHAAAEYRGVIEQAKGVIMSTTRCSADAAFAVLVAQSQAENRKLRELAQEIAARQDWHRDPSQ